MTSTARSLSPKEPVLILGAGLMGRLLGVMLARAGHPVRLVDAGTPDGSGGAARVAAAMLAPLAESAVTESNVVAMGQYALKRWPELLSTLVAPVFFQQSGTLVLWHRQDTAEAHRFRAILGGMQQTLPDLPHARAVDGPAIAELEPSLAPRFHQGLYLPEEGQLDNRELLQALNQTLSALGAPVEWQTVWTLEQAQAYQQAHGGWVLDCRGLGAKDNWQADGGGLRGVRGEVARLHAPDVTLDRPTRLLHPRYPIYIAPKPGHVFVIGATEIETNDLTPASVRSTLELLSAAYAVHPGFGEARILELNTQCRPTLADNLPAVRECAPQVLQINGLYRHGFMISPAVADSVLEYLENRTQGLAQRLGLRFESCASAAVA